MSRSSKNKRSPLYRAYGPGRASGKELRRCSNGNIHPTHKESRKKAGYHIAHVIEDASSEALIAGYVGPNANYPNAFHDLALPELVFVAWKHFSLGKVGRAGDDGDPVPRFYPFARMFERAGRGSVHFGRKIVSEEENMHQRFATTIA